jgi:methylated-DNA-[protein]-cysteine S-methyltransferase
MSTLFEMIIDSPVGRLGLVANESALVAIRFEKEAHPFRAKTEPARRHAILEYAAGELDEYFRLDRRLFATPLQPEGTPFQQQTWAALREIPFGEQISYRELARRIGRPGASRAVGGANGRNPIPIIVPCHRVIGADGTLTGFGGGLDVKRWLLDHERNKGQAQLFA